MALAVPVVPPAPLVHVVAPTPALRQARNPTRVKTETINAVEAMERVHKTSARKKRGDRGQILDIII
ncbi:hypothetical protein [Fodinicurvata sp. EGI_FJ10296]|uniref:hypothetical protein n=1 Tax=Fodinicurvata sp. EGI_FJ10296 TaxID=3231908 RepID=UPI00345199F1